MGQFAHAFMTTDPRARIVAAEFWPAPAGPLYDDLGQQVKFQLGNVCFKAREEPGDTWGPPTHKAHSVPFGPWVDLMRSEGFAVVEIYDEDNQGRPVRKVTL